MLCSALANHIFFTQMLKIQNNVFSKLFEALQIITPNGFLGKTKTPKHIAVTVRKS